MNAKDDNKRSGVPESEAVWLGSLYRQLGKKAAGIMRKPPGKTVGGREFRQARAAELGRQIREAARQVDAAAAKYIGRITPKLWATARARADQQAREAGVRPDDLPIKGSFSLLDSRSAAVFARDCMADLRKASAGVVSTAERVLRMTSQTLLDENDLNLLLAGGALAGTPRETARELKGLLEAAADGKLLMINGRDYNVAKYAAMVVRTKTRQAVITARHERLSELGLDLVAITGRVSDNFCTAYLGQVFSLSGNHPKYPALASLPGGGPPFHPNCSKGIRPWIKSLATPIQKDVAEPDPDVAKLLGVNRRDAQKSFDALQLRSATVARYGKVRPLAKETINASGAARQMRRVRPLPADELVRVLPARPAGRRGEATPRKPTRRRRP